MQIHHGLRGSRADDTGLGPAGKCHDILGGARRDENGVALDVREFVADLDRDLVSVVDSGDDRVEADRDALLFGACQKLFADSVSANFRFVLL
jgi:hypothetical protein